MLIFHCNRCDFKKDITELFGTGNAYTTTKDEIKIICPKCGFTELI